MALKLSRRFKNIIRRLLEGDSFYTNATPRISIQELNDLSKIGIILQVENLYGAEAGSPRIVYPLNNEQFKKRAKEILDTTSVNLKTSKD